MAKTAWPTKAASKQPIAQPVIPAEMRELLGPPPLTSRENADAYERVLSQMALAISPTDFIEWTWVKDLVDLGWEAGRARRAKAVRIAMARKKAILSLLEADWPDTPDLALRKLTDLPRQAQAVLRGDAEDTRHFHYALDHLSLDESAIDDSSYNACLDDIERLETLIDNANARRDAILREIDRRRDAVAKRARAAAEAIAGAIDAEFE